jgi:hypothetical protein
MLEIIEKLYNYKLFEKYGSSQIIFERHINRESIANLYFRSIENNTLEINKNAFLKLKTSIIKHMAICEINEKIIGWSYIYKNINCINVKGMKPIEIHAWVKPEYRLSGIGRKLVKFLISETKSEINDLHYSNSQFWKVLQENA